MAMYGESWLSEVGTQLRSVVDAFSGRGEGARDADAPLSPCRLFNKPSFLSPAVAVGGLLAVLLLSAWP
jgi:hypothetical protein